MSRRSSLAPELTTVVAVACATGVAAVQTCVVGFDGCTTWGTPVNGWKMSLKLGDFGTDYMLRAHTALAAIGANRAEDAVYPRALVDGDGKPLNVVSCTILPVMDPGLLYVERVSFVTPDDKEVSLANLTGNDDFTLIYRTNEVAVYENLDVMPRAFLAHDARVVDDNSALAEMQRNDFKPAQLVFLANGAPIRAGGAQRDDESVQTVSYKPERVVLSAHASADAYLVLADAWFPDWIARIDGVEVPLQRADLMFRAVRVSPGDHQIEFEYRPISLYIGTLISAIALVIIGAIFVRTR
jgi:hypothetical protein